MYKKFEDWLNVILQKNFPKDVIAANFNIYEDEENEWSVEIVGTRSFCENDEEWACDEVTDLGSRENLFVITYEGNWERVHEIVFNYVKSYLEQGYFCEKLRALEAVGVGFVDGNIEIAYLGSSVPLGEKQRCDKREY